MWPLLASLGPRLLIPGFFLGPRIAGMDDTVQIFQTIALSLLFVTFAVTLFSDDYWLAIIPGVAAWAYWNMIRDPQHLERYRYTDWAITTPMMLLAILIVNGASTGKMATILLLDLLMIGAGYLGVKEHDKTKKRSLFALGCVIFLPILYVLIQMKKTKYAVYLTLAMWTLYPLVWLADEEQAIEKRTANMSYAVMDVIAKVGLVNLLRL